MQMSCIQGDPQPQGQRAGLVLSLAAALHLCWSSTLQAATASTAYPVRVCRAARQAVKLVQAVGSFVVQAFAGSTSAVLSLALFQRLQHVHRLGQSFSCLAGSRSKPRSAHRRKFKSVITGLLPLAPSPVRPGVVVFSTVSCGTSPGVLALKRLNLQYSYEPLVCPQHLILNLARRRLRRQCPWNFGKTCKGSQRQPQ